jgi:hypothetical protein
MLRNRKAPITSPRDWSAVYSLAQETRGRSVRRHFIVVRLTADIMMRYCCSRDTGSHHDDLSSPQQQISSCTSSRNEGWIWSVEGRVSARARTSRAAAARIIAPDLLRRSEEHTSTVDDRRSLPPSPSWFRVAVEETWQCQDSYQSK